MVLGSCGRIRYSTNHNEINCRDAAGGDRRCDAKGIESARRIKRPGFSKMENAPQQMTVKSENSRTCLLIVGMHRSGTSAMTRVLSLLGADLPTQVNPPAEGNLAGHWEPKTICDLNEEIFESAGTNWHDWMQMNPDWFASPKYQEYRNRAKAAIVDEFGGSHLFALKDPRVCRLGRFWIDTLLDMGVEPKVVFVLRNPIEVAQSLSARNNLDTSVGQLIWLRNVLEIEEATRGSTRTFATYDGLFDDWRGVTERIASDIDLTFPRMSRSISQQISEFISPKFRTQTVSDDLLRASPEVSKWVVETYRVLSEWSVGGERPEDFETLSKITQMLNEATPVFDRLVSLSGYRKNVIDRLEVTEREAVEKLSDATIQLTKTESALTERTDELSRVSAELTEAKNRSVSLAQNLEKVAEEQRSLRENYSDEVSKLTAAKNEIEQRLAMARSEISQRAEEISQVSSELEDVKAQHKEEAESNRKRSDEWETERASLQNELLNLQSRIEQVTTELECANQSAEDARTEAAIANKKAGDARSEAAAETFEIVTKLQNALNISTQKLDARFGETAMMFDRLKGAELRLRESDSRLKRQTVQVQDLSKVARERDVMLAELRKERNYWLKLANKRQSIFSRLIGKVSQGAKKLRASQPPLSPEFDADWYLSTYPDVKASTLDPWEHYCRFGRKEGRGMSANSRDVAGGSSDEQV